MVVRGPGLWNALLGALRVRTWCPHALQRIVSLSVLALALVFADCGRSDTASPTPEDRLVVFAAASLRDVFLAMEHGFRQAQPGAEITFNSAGTQQLRTQLEHGAVADVFASADRQ